MTAATNNDDVIGRLGRLVLPQQRCVVGKLDHPGIVPIHDVGLDEQGEFFFVMKFVDGEPLESVVERVPRWQYACERLAEARARMRPAAGTVGRTRVEDATARSGGKKTHTRTSRP